MAHHVPQFVKEAQLSFKMGTVRLLLAVLVVIAALALTGCSEEVADPQTPSPVVDTPEPTSTPIPFTATPIPPTPIPTATATPTLSPPTATPTPTAGSHAAIEVMPWLHDGRTLIELKAVEKLRAISSMDEASAALILGFSWVMDGITEPELEVIGTIHRSLNEDTTLAMALLTSSWLEDGVSEDDSRAIDILREVEKIDQETTRLLFNLPWVADGVTFTEFFDIRLIRDMAELSPESATQLLSLPWVIDGLIANKETGAIGWLNQILQIDSRPVTLLLSLPWAADDISEEELRTIGTMLRVSRQHPDSAVLLLNTPWIADDITSIEKSIITTLASIVDADPEFAKDVLGLWWMDGDLAPMERHALKDIWILATYDLALAKRVVEEPFMEPPFRYRDQYALGSLSALARDRHNARASSDELLAQLTTTAWFSDGIDDLEAALLYVIATSPTAFGQALIETPYVAARPVNLPLTGDVELIVVRSTPFPRGDRTLVTMEEAIRSVEGFMGAPFPVTDVVLLITEPEIWTINSGAQLVQHNIGGPEGLYVGAHIRINNTVRGFAVSSLTPIYHEMAHYYYLHAPFWLTEGVAQFLESYTIAGGNATEIEKRLMTLEEPIGDCNRDNIQQHLDNRGERHCYYHLGEKFMLGMYLTVGQETVAATLRDIYERSRFLERFDEEAVYQAFFSNTPPEKQVAFMTTYRQYHGDSIVDEQS